MRILIGLAALALTSECLLAVDGQGLINNSTVIAAGGYPYIISSPGSYKLTGNLTLSTTSGGNYHGMDVAIGINSSKVDLDLNGFSIIVTNDIPALVHNFFAIAELGTFSQISIRNGNIHVKSTNLNTAAAPAFGIFLHTSSMSRVIGTSVLIEVENLFGARTGRALDIGVRSIVWHNTFDVGNDVLVQCPSMIAENATVGSFPPPCVDANNAH